MKHLVIGGGEVGSAVVELFWPDVVSIDLVPQRWVRGVPEPSEQAQWDPEYLHVCIPWSDNFEAFVKDYVEEFRPDVVVVHSTVPAGTCDRHGWVHSPIRGSHPDLLDGLFRFTKHFGGEKSALAAIPFIEAGVKVHCVDRALETEAGKLWELAQFALQVVVEKAIFQYCDDHGVNAGVVYSQFAQTYNAGWTELGESKYVRPVLDHMPGSIGGHCVLPGTGLLDHPIKNFILGAAEGFEDGSRKEE